MNKCREKNLGFFNVNINLEKNQKCIIFNEKLDLTKINFLIGPNGSGKTSILKCLAGIESNFQNKSKNEIDIKLFLVNQQSTLISHLSVMENLKFAANRNQSEISIDEVVETFKLNRLLNHSSQKLSGGERKRVCIAQGLLTGSDLLLLDEPDVFLDIESKIMLLDYLRILNKEYEVGLFIVSHSREFIQALDGFVYRLNAEGVVVKRADVENFLF